MVTGLGRNTGATILLITQYIHCITFLAAVEEQPVQCQHPTQKRRALMVPAKVKGKPSAVCMYAFHPEKRGVLMVLATVKGKSQCSVYASHPEKKDINWPRWAPVPPAGRKPIGHYPQ